MSQRMSPQTPLLSLTDREWLKVVREVARDEQGRDPFLVANTEVRAVLDLLDKAVNQYDALQAENATLRTALESLWANLTGSPKPCGHNFVCACADDLVRAALSPQAPTPEPK